MRTARVADLRVRPRRLTRLVLAGISVPGAAAAAIFLLSEARLQKHYEVPESALEIRIAPDSIARGRHLAHVVAQCAHCHGEDLGGRSAADTLALGRLYAPNLTSGVGGIGAAYSDAHLAAAIRSGIDRDGRPLLVMPSQYLRAVSDRDLGALIAYMRSVPAVDRATPAKRIGPLTRLALVMGLVPDLLPAERIHHESVAETTSSDYAEGRYLVELGGCRVCHHSDLSGGLHPLAVAGEPVPPDLTPSGPLSGWSEGNFIRTMRAGITPQGRRLDARFMPWPRYAGMTDRELRAIWVYLSSTPSRVDE